MKISTGIAIMCMVSQLVVALLLYSLAIITKINPIPAIIMGWGIMFAFYLCVIGMVGHMWKEVDVE